MKLDYTLEEIKNVLACNLLSCPDDPYFRGALNRIDNYGLEGVREGIINIPEVFLPNYIELKETFKEGKVEIKVDGKTIFIVL